MTFDPGAQPDPRALRDAVRRVDFTPTDLRYWVEGTIESEASPPTLVLVSETTGQRFALEATPGAAGRAVFDALADLRSTLTLWGVVEARQGSADIMLRVEGHEAARP